MNRCDFSCKHNLNSSFMHWLIELLGPVILGSKSAEIITINYNDRSYDEKISDITKHFSNCRVINYKILEKDGCGTRIFFYNLVTMDKILGDKKIIAFLEYLGYAKGTTKDYLNILFDKIMYDEFPNEIGLFLGYPLKDVLGFMGYSILPYKKTNYWKIYGDEEPSIRLYQRFVYHRNAMRNLMEKKDPLTIISLY